MIKTAVVRSFFVSEELMPDMPTDNNTNVAKTPMFQRFYEKCSLAVHTVQLRSPFPKII